jgi:hypothetical protein
MRKTFFCIGYVADGTRLFSSMNDLFPVGVTNFVAYKTSQGHLFAHLSPFIMFLCLLQIAFAHSVDDDCAAGEGASHPSNFMHDGKALAFLLGLAVTDAKDTSTDYDEYPFEEDDAAPPPLLSHRVFQQQKGHVHFNDNDEDDNTGANVLLDEEQVKLLDDFKIMGGDDIVGSFLMDSPLGDNQPAVDDCESPGKLFIDVSPSFGEIFDNGLGDTFFNEGSLLRGFIETNKQRKSFLESWSGPSSVLRALPFLWDKRKVACTHYFADVFFGSANCVYGTWLWIGVFLHQVSRLDLHQEGRSSGALLQEARGCHRQVCSRQYCCKPGQELQCHV